MIHAKSFFLILISIFIGLFACNNDDDAIGDCETLVEEESLLFQVAHDELPNAIFDRTSPFLYVNDIADTLVFEAGQIFDFSSDRIIKTPCANGDTTTGIYKGRNISKSFESITTDLEFNFSAQISTNRMTEIDGDGNLVITYEGCFVENYGIFIRNANDVFNTASVQETLNPNDCAAFDSSFQNFDILQEVTLNGITYNGEIKKSKDNFTSNPLVLYYDQEIGVIEFEHEDDVIWNLVQ